MAQVLKTIERKEKETLLFSIDVLFTFYIYKKLYLNVGVFFFFFFKILTGEEMDVFFFWEGFFNLKKNKKKKTSNK